jgi:hypothetical protein
VLPLRILLTASWFGSIAFGSPIGDRQAPRPTIIPEYDLVPETLQQLWQASDIIVIGVVGAHERFESRYGSAPPLLYTKYQVALTMLLKGDSRSERGHSIAVIRQGYEVDKRSGTSIVEEEGFSRFVEGSRYLLFLEWRESLQGYIVVSGPNGSYELNHLVHSEGKSPVARKYSGVSEDAFVAEILQHK